MMYTFLRSVRCGCTSEKAGKPSHKTHAQAHAHIHVPNAPLLTKIPRNMTPTELREEERRLDVFSTMWITYRNGFPKMEPYGYTDDSGWGCMLRSAQMLMTQALQRHSLGRYHCKIVYVICACKRMIHVRLLADIFFV